MGIVTEPPKMFLCSTQISHRTWRSQMKSWSALQEPTLIMCEFPNIVESHFCMYLFSFKSQSFATETSVKKKNRLVLMLV